MTRPSHIDGALVLEWAWSETAVGHIRVDALCGARSARHSPLKP